MSDPNLVTTCNFNGHEYFVKMNTSNNILELNVTDKQTGEDWQCCYDASYIENVTQKTGNFKQFSIFVAMLKSGLLKTTNCVYLDFMTFDDLDALRNHRIRGPFSSYHMAQSNTNRRYLILTYTVEFDRIHYPLPLEYCGPPDPQILQQHIVRLEDEIMHLKDQTKRPDKLLQDTRQINTMQKRIDDLTEDNRKLYEEIRKLKMTMERPPKNRNEIYVLQHAIKSLEKSVLSERKSHHQLVEKLRKDKLSLAKELDRIKSTEKLLRVKLQTKFNSRDDSLKRTSEGTGGRVKSRSVSPRVCRSDSWETQMIPDRQPRSLRVKNQRKSGSGSEGSVRYTSPTNHKAKKAPKPRNPPFLSRSESPSSRNSSLSPKRSHFHNSTNVHTSLTSPKRSRSKTSELDFSALENRIQALQKMLHDGLVIN